MSKNEEAQYTYAEFCGCTDPQGGDGVHVGGEPSDLICLASPVTQKAVSDE